MKLTLSRYCLNREAVRFALVRFIIHHLHDKNNKTCSKAHFISNYPDLAHINTQCVE